MPNDTTFDNEVLRVIAELLESGFPPTVREIAGRLGQNSPTGVHRSLIRLRDEGRLTWRDGRSRTLKLLSN